MRMLLIAIVLAAVGAPAAGQDTLNRFADTARPAVQAAHGLAWTGPDAIDGAQRLRWGYNEAGNQGLQTCDGDLLAMAKSSYRIDAAKRDWCLRQEREAARALGQEDGLAPNPTREAIEDAYGPEFDERLAQFRRATRFALRPIVEVARYDAQRGALDAFMKLPLLNGFDIGGYRGQNIVPDMVGNGRSVYAPPHAGTFKAAFGMTSAEAATLTTQPQNRREHLMVFDVLGAGRRDGTDLPQLEIRVVRARVGFGDKALGFDRREGVQETKR